MKLGHQGAEHRARQRRLAPDARADSDHLHQVAIVIGRAELELDAVDIDDAAIARLDGIHGGKGGGREIELGEGRRQPQIELGEFLDAAPEHAEEAGAVGQGKPPRVLLGKAPILAGKPARPGGEVAGEIFPKLEDRLRVEMGGDDRAAGSPLQLVQQIADLVGAGHRRIELQPVGVEIAEIAVGQDPDELGLRQELQGDRIARRGFPAPGGETGDEARRFLVAGRVDLLQEIQLLPVEFGNHRFLAAGGARRRLAQAGNEVGFAGLAGAEDADAHAPARGALQLAGRTLDAPRTVDQRQRLARHPRGVRLDLRHPMPGIDGGAAEIPGGAGKRLVCHSVVLS